MDPPAPDDSRPPTLRSAEHASPGVRDHVAHRWPVFAGWFILTIGLFVLSQALGGIKADDPKGNPNQSQTESAKAYAVPDQVPVTAG